MTGSPEFDLNKADTVQLAAHLRACNDVFMPPLSDRINVDDYASKIAGRAQRFEVWVNCELVGLVAAYCNDLERRTAFITSVSVLPKWQGQGIASRLMEICVGHVRSLGFKRIELEVEGSNAAAVTLYMKHGFTKNGSNSSSKNMILDLGE